MDLGTDTKRTHVEYVQKRLVYVLKNHSGGSMSQVLVMIFIFGNTLKTTFEAIIFLFVMHPFDVGDRCLIDGVQVPTNSIMLAYPW